MTLNRALFTSNKEEYETPDDLFERLNNEFHFNLDACATKENSKCEIFFDKKVDGLKQDWKGNVFMNPPYGKNIGEWIKKAYIESQNGCLVVCLLPSRTQTKWFHDYCLKGEVRFIRGKLKFKGTKHDAPFPSMIVIFK